MAPCCPCKSTGRCLSCFCVKRGTDCTNCYPGRADRCVNQPAIDRPLGLGKGSSQPQLARHAPETSRLTLSQPALPSTASSGGPPTSSCSTEASSRGLRKMDSQCSSSSGPVRVNVAMTDICVREQSTNHPATSTTSCPRQPPGGTHTPEGEAENNNHVLVRDHGIASDGLNVDGLNSNSGGDDAHPQRTRITDREPLLDRDQSSTRTPASRTSPGPVRVTDRKSSVRELPAYKPCSELDFTWGNLSGRDFAHSIRCA